MSELVLHQVTAIYHATTVLPGVNLVISHDLLRHPEVLWRGVSFVFLRLQHHLHV